MESEAVDANTETLLLKPGVLGTQPRALCKVRKPNLIQEYDQDLSKAERFAAEFRREPGTPVAFIVAVCADSLRLRRMIMKGASC